jgi:hypothetical protein
MSFRRGLLSETTALAQLVLFRSAQRRATWVAHKTRFRRLLKVIKGQYEVPNESRPGTAKMFQGL